jgi:hypothetical protein
MSEESENYEKFKIARSEILGFLEHYLRNNGYGYSVIEEGNGGCRDVKLDEVKEAAVSYLATKYLND